MKYTYTKISKNIYDCSSCATRCDGVSKGIYTFEKDAEFSEKYENIIIEQINKFGKNSASKTSLPGYPDIEIRNSKTKEVDSYLEIKVQRRTFMSVQKYLKSSGLFPSETVALNLSDLLRYFEIRKASGKPVFILWVLLNRPCILDAEKHLFFYQNIDVLKEIYAKHKNKRRFRRQSGKGDVVAGVHKGVVVNYHFSLNELKRKNSIVS